MALQQFFVREYAVWIKRRREDNTHFNIQETLEKNAVKSTPSKSTAARRFALKGIVRYRSFPHYLQSIFLIL